MDRGAWQTTVHRIAKSQMQLTLTLFLVSSEVLMPWWEHMYLVTCSHTRKEAAQMPARHQRHQLVEPPQAFISASWCIAVTSHLVLAFMKLLSSYPKPLNHKVTGASWPPPGLILVKPSMGTCLGNVSWCGVKKWMKPSECTKVSESININRRLRNGWMKEWSSDWGVGWKEGDVNECISEGMLVRVRNWTKN